MGCFGIIVNGVQSLGSDLAFVQGADLSMGAGSQVLLDAGTSSLPGLAFRTEASLGLHRPSAGILAIVGSKLAINGTDLTDVLGAGAASTFVKMFGATTSRAINMFDNGTVMWFAISDGIRSGFVGAANATDGIAVGSVSAHSYTIYTTNAARWAFQSGTGNLVGVGTKLIDSATRLNIGGANNIRFSADATGLSFFNATPVAQQTGVAVTAAGIHAALVNYGLITA